MMRKDAIDEHKAIRNMSPNLSKDDKPFDLHETEFTIKRMNKGKVPGPDGFPVEIIQKLYLANKELF